MSSFLSYAGAMRNLGARAFVHYAAQRLRDRWVPRDEFLVRSRFARHPLWCRHGSTDVAVFGQIFVRREYRCLDHLRHAGRILDCGAYVGYSTAYFLSRFPEAEVTAVEPDPANFRQLERNVRPYGARAHLVRGAVWSGAVPLRFDEAAREAAGGAWGVALREARPGESPALVGTPLPDLVGDRPVDILKMDVEGAEARIFAGDCRWLAQVRNLVIELHGAAIERAVLDAIAWRGFRVVRCDELHACLG